MTELEQHIKSYFGIIQPEDLQTIGSLFKEQQMKRGDFFLQAGEQCKRLSFMHSGLMRMYANTDSKEVTQWISTLGYFVTDLSSFLFEKPARFYIQALSDCAFYTISRENYQRIGHLVPHWHELEKLFLAKCFTLLEDRIFMHLSMSAEERYQLFFEQNKELFNQVPLQYLASMLGMTPETFSRIRKKPIS